MPTLHLRHGIPTHPQHRRLAAAQAISTFGDSLAGCLLAVMFAVVYSATPTQIALALSGIGAGSMIGAVVGGSLSDTLGYRRVASASFAACALCTALLAAAPTMLTATVAAICAALFLRSGKASRNAYIARTAGPARVALRAYLRSVLNVSYAAGAAAATFATLLVAGTLFTVDPDIPFRVALAIDAATSLAAAALYAGLARDPAPPHRPHDASAPSPPKTQGGAWRDGPYLAMVAALGLLVNMYGFFAATLTIFFIIQHDAPLWLVPTSLGIFTVVSVGAQVLATHRVKDTPSATRAAITGAFWCLVAFVGLAVSPLAGRAGMVGIVLVCAVILVVGDVLISAGRWELEMTLARPEAQGSYSGAADTFFGASGTALPHVAVITTLAAGWGWLGAIGLFAAAAAALPTLVARVLRHRQGIEA